MKAVLKLKLPLFGIAAVTAFVCLLIYVSPNEPRAESSPSLPDVHENYQIRSVKIPIKAMLAGEEVPLHLTDVKERLERELLINAYWQSQTVLFIKRSQRWFPVIEAILTEEAVPSDMKYLALIESGFTSTVSPAGAAGYWQWTTDAAKQYGLEVSQSIDERYHVEKATRAACVYLRQAKEEFGTWSAAAASYNMGISGFRKQCERQQTKDYFDMLLNEETSRYVFRILAAKIILESPELYGYEIPKSEQFPPYDFTVLEIKETIPDLSNFARSNGFNYKVLKILNPWLRDNELNVASGRKYELKIPTQSLRQRLMRDTTLLRIEPEQTRSLDNEIHE